MRLCKHGKSVLLPLSIYFSRILANLKRHNLVYIPLPKHTYRPMRARVVSSRRISGRNAGGTTGNASAVRRPEVSETFGRPLGDGYNHEYRHLRLKKVKRFFSHSPHNSREQLGRKHKDGVKRIHDRELSNHCKDYTTRYKTYK